MEFVGSIVDSVFGPVFSFFSRTFHYSMSCEHYIDSLHKEIDELRSKRDDVKREVDREARHGLEATNEVLFWLRNVDDLEEQATKIFDDFRTSFANQAGFSKLVSSYKLSNRADEAREEASSLKGKSNFNEVADKLAPVRFEERPNAMTVGMDSMIEHLRQVFDDDDVGIIGIHGMGGVGKTALLNRFNNEILVHVAYLNVVMFIKVTKDFDVEKTQRAIGDRLGLSWDERKTEDERAMILFKVLSKMKFVLLLEDLWEPLELAAIGIPTPTGQSKVILTTRIEDVCDRMDAKKIKLDCLAWDDAWELFQKKAGEKLISSDPLIRQHAEDIARKCGGLPLALITVGRAMASKRTSKEWRHAVMTISNTPWQLLSMEENVLRRLKLSYDKLSDDRLKTFLLYAALQVGMQHKSSIIELCIGEGVVDDFDDPEDAYSEGYHLLGILKAASLLESGETEDHVKVHPLVRAMVSWIVCDYGNDSKWLVQPNASLAEAPEVEKWEHAERISLVSNEISSLPEELNCEILSTLLLGDNKALRKIPDGFFRSMPCLKVLDLHSTSIRELPVEIGCLLKLQYLDVNETSITSIPKELGNLVKLRFLLLTNTPHLKTIPSGVIANLKELRVLCMYNSYGNWKVSASGSGISFEELEGLRRLRYLDITLDNAGILQRLVRSRRLAMSTRYMHIRSCAGLTTIQLPFTSFGRYMKSLRCLRISNSSKLEDIVVGGNVEDEWSVLANLNVLMLRHLLKAKVVFKDRSFPNLKFLHIYNCSGLEQLVYFNDEFEEEEEETGVITAFPHLKELDLFGLPELKSLAGERRVLAFPCLHILKVAECPKLKKISMKGDELVGITGSQEWWDGLEWEDSSTKENFMPLFAPLVAC